MMSIVWISLLLFVVTVDVINADAKVTKLQIGVKKRVDNCSVKSKKGDVLHMHYTVSCCDSILMQLCVFCREHSRMALNSIVVEHEIHHLHSRWEWVK